MKISTLVYKKYLVSSGIKRKVWSLSRKFLIKIFKDPICKLAVHGRILYLPLSHQLPFYLRQCPLYDRLPQRIGAFLHENQDSFNCIDVGANIGDTIAAFYPNQNDRFIAVEPNPNFSRFLLRNWGDNENVAVVSDVCSSSNDQSNFTIQEQEGTATILHTKSGKSMEKKTLDTILDNNVHIKNVDILKIDTDGHDFEVLKGARKLLAANLPIVLFECDPFENINYVQECIDALNYFNESGYKNFLLYDNLGNLMGLYSLNDLTSFKNLLFHQLVNGRYYFDILVMKDDDIFVFHRNELEFFMMQTPKTALQNVEISTFCV